MRTVHLAPLWLVLALITPRLARADRPVAVLIEESSSARRVFPVQRTRQVERAVRRALGRDVIVRRRRSLRGEAAECPPDEEACRAVLRRALRAERVLVLRLVHTTVGAGRDSRGRHRMGVRGRLLACWLNDCVATESLPLGADDDAWLAALDRLLAAAAPSAVEGAARDQTMP